MRHLRLWRWRGQQTGVALVRAIPAIACAMVLLRVGAAAAHTQIEPAWPRGNLDRVAIMRQLEATPGRHLVIVSYGPHHDVDWEWVYNAADIDGAKVVWARDMGARDNQELLQLLSRPTGVALERRPVAAEAGAMNIDSWLTARRVRIHGLLLAVCLWTVYAVDMSTPGLLDRNGLVKGTDFLHFYTLGTLALRGRGDLLYNMRAQAELARELVAQAPNSLYVPLYGPQVSLFFAPLRPVALRMGADGMAGGERSDLRLLLPRGVEDLSESSDVSLDSSDPGDCLSGIFSPAGLGTDFRSRAVVFHAGLSRPAARSDAARRIGHWIAHLQAPAGTGRGSCLCVRARVEGGGGRGGGRVHPAWRRPGCTTAPRSCALTSTR